MNVNTGELRKIGIIGAGPEFRDFTPVPDNLFEEAANILREEERAFADMSEDTPLTKWAKSQQVHAGPNRASRRRMVKESRRKNRR